MTVLVYGPAEFDALLDVAGVRDALLGRAPEPKVAQRLVNFVVAAPAI